MTDSAAGPKKPGSVRMYTGYYAAVQTAALFSYGFETPSLAELVYRHT